MFAGLSLSCPTKDLLLDEERHGCGFVLVEPHPFGGETLFYVGKLLKHTETCEQVDWTVLWVWAIAKLYYYHQTY